MTAAAFVRAAQAQATLRLNEELLGELDGAFIEQPHFVIGRLEAALRESGRVIEELVAELAGRSS